MVLILFLDFRGHFTVSPFEKAFGIVFGCLLGMFPLLFIDTGKKRSEKTEEN